MEVKQPAEQDSLNPNDFRPMQTKEIPFMVELDGIRFSGKLNPTGENLPFGTHVGFMVRIPGKVMMNITILEGEWIMPGAPKKFARILGEWIERYYE
jgi:hypothetical protein